MTFLSHVKMASFGAFSNRVIGPFGPNLNVVYGANEAGKTTAAAFVRGVLFGWEDGRSNRNTYRPEAAERAGSLFFTADDGGELELSRGRNAEGLQGADSIVADIDRETFSTMFSLTSDELRRLKNTTDVTARLLTAGSGTGASPAHALGVVQTRLAECTSRAGGAKDSVVRLEAEASQLREQMAKASEAADLLRREDREFHELSPQRDDLSERLSRLNARIEELGACRTSVENLLSDRAELEEERARLSGEEVDAAVEARRMRRKLSQDLASLSSSEDRDLRDGIDSLDERQAKSMHNIELAKMNYSASKAAYEVRQESPDVREVEIRARHKRTAQVGLSVLLPLVFVVAGIVVALHGREIASLSFMALGLSLIAVATLLAGGALFMLFRPNKEEEERKAGLQSAQWVMLQDQKKYESCMADQEKLNAEIAEFLSGNGLGEAGFSLRRARSLLDDAKDARNELALLEQRRKAVSARVSDIDVKLAGISEQLRGICDQARIEPDDPISAINAKISRKAQQRASLLEASERVNRRYGELSTELAAGRGQHGFDEVKLAYQQVRTRLQEAKQNLARLLIARRMLEAAIAAWESKSQPEVYAQASRLMSLMTGGRWVRIDMTGDGRLVATDAARNEREPLQLSLGTCQQLYLSLRIALLMEADNVGRAIPILADDILVNFDAERRCGAARALAELAKSRQVIVFTCHREVVSVLREVDGAAKLVELGV